MWSRDGGRESELVSRTRSFAFVSLLLAFTACAGETAPSTQRPADSQPPEATQSVDGATSYLRRCGGCHGAVGSEQAEQSLSSVSELTRGDVENIVRNGNPYMPAFGDSLEDAEIDAIVDHVMENL